MAWVSCNRNNQLSVFVVKLIMFHLPCYCSQGVTTTAADAGSCEREAAVHGNNTSSGDVNRRLCKEGRLREAINNVHGMEQQGILPHFSAYASLLHECGKRIALLELKRIHAHIIHIGFNAQMFLQHRFVIAYAKCGSLMDARHVLDEMRKPNVVLWNVIIAAYARRGFHGDALKIFYKMQRTGIQPDHFTFVSVLSACANLAALGHGQKIHEEIVNGGFVSNIYVMNALVHMYVECGTIEVARHVFDKMLERNVISWNSMIVGHIQNRDTDEALKLFQKMPERSLASWNVMIRGYVQNADADDVLNFFQKMPERDVVSWTTIISEYARNGYVEEAFKLFDKMPQRDSVSWTSMIAGYAQNGYIDEALKLFKKMPKRDAVSWTAMVVAYANGGHVEEALTLFQKMPKRDTFSWNAMITGYAQNGYFDEAWKLFHNMPAQDAVSWTAMIAGYTQRGHVDKASRLFQKIPKRDTVSWTAMIAGYAQNGHSEKALMLFRQMQLTGLKPASDIFSSVLPACANLASLKPGKEIHGNIIRRGCHLHVFVGSALIDMYAKCGNIADACTVFNKMPEQPAVSWNVMIGGYAMHGYSKEALQLFDEMQHSGVKPDHVTFVGVLSACSHAGLVDNGWQYFNSMSRDHHIIPTVEHYGCMVDLLGRAGHLNEVRDFINKMPIKASAALWGSVLGACRIHTNIELGECAAERLFKLEFENAANYAGLSNIYAAAGRWDDVEKVQKWRKDRGIQKNPGCSWIEVNSNVHTFLVRELTFTKE